MSHTMQYDLVRIDSVTLKVHYDTASINADIARHFFLLCSKLFQAAQEQAAALHKEMDKDGDGQVSLDELFLGCDAAVQNI